LLRNEAIHQEQDMRDSTLIMLGSLLAALGVMLGAFGAHALKARVTPEMLEVWQTAVFYHLVHALAVLLVATLAVRLGTSVGWIAMLFIAGILLFSGSLYALVLTGMRPLGMITPIGGVLFIAGWVWLSVTAWRVS
jgi:uncharacterized membrane protein YgdD (TMEM256/DUF423 family)